jgi:hypothetical protein
MNSMVVGVLALASALVRERGEMLGDWTARTPDSYPVVLPQTLAGDAEAGAEVGAAPTNTVMSGGAGTTDGTNESSTGSAVASSDASSPAGQWEIACEIKSGSALVFDRGSLREYGTVTLVRWSAPRTRLAAPGDQIFTAVVNCREKTIEAAWPGRNRETRAGTCGRGLVEAVCAASGQAAATDRSPRPAQRTGRKPFDSAR